MRAQILLALLALSCAQEHRVVEPWTADLRVAVLLPSTGAPSFVPLAGAAPLSIALEPYFSAEAKLEVWLLGYRLADLATAFPTLAGRSAEDAARLLKPRFEAVRGEPTPSQIARIHLEDGADPGGYSAESLPAWEARLAALGTRLALRPEAEPPYSDCLGARITEVDAGTQALSEIAFVDERRAIFAGPVRSISSSQPTFLGRVEDTVVARLTTNPLVRGLPRSVAADNTRTVYIVTSTVHRIDAQGAARPVPPPPDGFHVGGVTAGPDGTIYYYGPDGLAEVRPGAARAMRRADWSGRVTRFFAPAHDRQYVFDEDTISVHAYDGVGWKVELTQIGIVDQVAAVGGDADVTLAYGYFNRVSIRRPDGRWETLPGPFDGAYHIRAVAGLGGGAFALVASTGLGAERTFGKAGLWNGQAWCELPLGVVDGLFGVAASGRTLYVVGEPNLNEPGKLAPFFRVELP